MMDGWMIEKKKSTGQSTRDERNDRNKKDLSHNEKKKMWRGETQND